LFSSPFFQNPAVNIDFVTEKCYHIFMSDFPIFRAGTISKEFDGSLNKKKNCILYDERKIAYPTRAVFTIVRLFIHE